MDRKKTWKRAALLVTNSLHSDNSVWSVNKSEWKCAESTPQSALVLRQYYSYYTLFLQRHNVTFHEHVATLGNGEN